MILVLGAGGQLGTAFCTLLGSRATAVRRTDLDLTEPGTIAPFVHRHKPDLVVNCAAYTAVDAAEEDAATARLVNARAVGELAAACRATGARFVTFSTDYVFAGTSSRPYVESDATDPRSVYGRTKREGEVLALAADPDALVIRTSWVLSGTHANFAATMLRLAASGGARVVNDQRGRPTLVDDLAPATLAAVGAGAAGLLHLANAGALTWYELAREVVTIGGYDPELIQPCTTAEFPLPAPRPANSELASERLEDLGLDPLPHHGAGLRRAVVDLIGGPHGPG